MAGCSTSLFNMYMLFHLGAAVETQRGWWRFALLILVIAVVSNLGEYFLGYQLNLTDSRALSAGMNPYFGGMSGVVYGIFGYIWMKSRHDPQSGFHLDQMTVVILLGWFVACFFMTGIANGAHGFGLAVGMIIGYGRIFVKSTPAGDRVEVARRADAERRRPPARGLPS